jgi:putative ABC transport system permease protein
VFLGIRELVFARGRFALMGAVVALISLLMVLLSGLSRGLVNDGVSGLMRMPVSHVAFEGGTKLDSAFSRSTVTSAQAATWATQDNVAEAALFGNELVNAELERGPGLRPLPLDLALFGVESDSWLAPSVAAGTGLGADAHGIVVSSTVAELGVVLGDVIVLDRLGTELTVVGITADQRTFGHVDVAYVPLRTWQEIHAGPTDGQPPPASAYNEATAVAVLARSGATVDVGAADAAAGTTAFTREQAFGASPGYTAETTTLTLIQVFLYVISALLIGAFFTVWTINRRHELAVIRAMGATAGYLVRDTIGQAAVVLLAAAAVGVGAGVAAGALLSGSAMPFALEARPVAGSTALLVALGLLGAGAAAARIARVDPITALGGNR